MSISFDAIFTVTGVRTGGVALAKSAIVGFTVAVFFDASMCSSITRSAPRSRRQGMPSGARILHRLPRHAVEPGVPVGAVPRARRARAIDADHRVMDRRAVGPELHAAHEHVGGDRGADDEVAI